MIDLNKIGALLGLSILVACTNGETETNQNQQIQAFIRQADKNLDDKISRAEFMSEVKEGPIKVSAPEREQTFLQYDLDHNGYVTAQELRHIARRSPKF